MNKTLANPFYLFSFQHIASKERISFFPQVITSNIRYDKFRFVESQTTNLSLVPPRVFFEYLGQYYYSIYECLTSGSTNPNLAFNKLESGRAWVIVGDDNPDECFFEPYISNDEDFAQVIYVSEEEEACIYPTPSMTPTMTITPTMTPTPSPTPASFLTFFVHQGNNVNQACNGTPDTNVYAANLGLCGPCSPNSCWPCLTTSQQVFANPSLTQIVPDGYYGCVVNGNTAVWHIVGGFPQPGGYTSC